MPEYPGKGKFAQGYGALYNKVLALEAKTDEIQSGALTDKTVNGTVVRIKDAGRKAATVQQKAVANAQCNKYHVSGKNLWHEATNYALIKDTSEGFNDTTISLRFPAVLPAGTYILSFDYSGDAFVSFYAQAYNEAGDEPVSTSVTYNWDGATGRKTVTMNVNHFIETIEIGFTINGSTAMAVVKDVLLMNVTDDSYLNTEYEAYDGEIVTGADGGDYEAQITLRDGDTYIYGGGARITVEYTAADGTAEALAPMGSPNLTDGETWQSVSGGLTVRLKNNQLTLSGTVAADASLPLFVALEDGLTQLSTTELKNTSGFVHKLINGHTYRLSLALVSASSTRSADAMVIATVERKTANSFSSVLGAYEGREQIAVLNDQLYDGEQIRLAVEIINIGSNALTFSNAVYRIELADVTGMLTPYSGAVRNSKRLTLQKANGDDVTIDGEDLEALLALLEPTSDP